MSLTNLKKVWSAKPQIKEISMKMHMIFRKDLRRTLTRREVKGILNQTMEMPILKATSEATESLEEND